MTLDALDEGIVQILVQYMIRAGIAILVILIGRVVARMARNAVAELLGKMTFDDSLGPSVNRLFKQAAYYGVMLLTFVIALVVLGVPVTTVVSLGGGMLILIGIALRESLSNLVATLTIVFYGTYRIGEDIDTKGKTGTVQEIQLFSTLLLMGDKGLLSMPNGEILASGVTNLSRLGIRRADVEFLVEYGQDMARIERIVLDTLVREPRVQSEPAPYVAVTQLGASGVTMQARPIVRYVDYDRFMLDARGLIKIALEAEGIHLATPHQSIVLENAP